LTGSGNRSISPDNIGRLDSCQPTRNTWQQQQQVHTNSHELCVVIDGSSISPGTISRLNSSRGTRSTWKQQQAQTWKQQQAQMQWWATCVN
jgi:hypothetical protein